MTRNKGWETIDFSGTRPRGLAFRLIVRMGALERPTSALPKPAFRGGNDV